MLWTPCFTKDLLKYLTHILISRNLAQNYIIIYSCQSFSCGTQRWFVQGSHPHFKFSPWEENIPRLAVILRASFLTPPLVTAKFHSSHSKDATYHIPKQRKKLPCLRTTSVFRNIKLEIYFQPPFPCPLISKMTLPSPMGSSLWQAAPPGLSEPCSSEGAANPQVHTTHILGFGGFSLDGHFPAQAGTALPAHAVSPCWKQQWAALYQELTTFFPLGFQLNRPSLIHRFPLNDAVKSTASVEPAHSQMLSLCFIIYTFCVQKGKGS